MGGKKAIVEYLKYVLPVCAWKSFYLYFKTSIDQQNEKVTYRMGENICKPISYKWLISKICKELIQHKSKARKYLILKQAKDINIYFSKEDIHMVNGISRGT